MSGPKEELAATTLAMAGNPRRVRIDDWGQSRHSSWRARSRAFSWSNGPPKIDTAPGIIRPALPTSGLLQLGRDRRKRAFEFGTKAVDNGNDRDENPCGDQAVFDSRSAGLVSQESSECLRDSTAAVIVLLLRSQKGPGRCSVQPGQGPIWAGQTRCRPRIRIGLASDRLTVLATPWRRGADVQFSGAVVPGGPCLVFLRHAPQLAGNLRSAREPSLTRTHSSEFD